MKHRHKVVRTLAVPTDAEDGIAALFPPKVHVEITASWTEGIDDGHVNAVMAEAANAFVEDVANSGEATSHPDHWSWETG